MPWVPFKMADGLTGIACFGRSRKRCACGKPGAFLCDWKIPAKKSGTCDAPLCARHAHEPAPDKHLCPAHAEEWKARQGG